MYGYLILCLFMILIDNYVSFISTLYLCEYVSVYVCMDIRVDNHDCDDVDDDDDTNQIN